MIDTYDLIERVTTDIFEAAKRTIVVAALAAATVSIAGVAAGGAVAMVLWLLLVVWAHAKLIQYQDVGRAVSLKRRLAVLALVALVFLGSGIFLGFVMQHLLAVQAGLEPLSMR